MPYPKGYEAEAPGIREHIIKRIGKPDRAKFLDVMVERSWAAKAPLVPLLGLDESGRTVVSIEDPKGIVNHPLYAAVEQAITYSKDGNDLLTKSGAHIADAVAEGLIALDAKRKIKTSKAFIGLTGAADFWIKRKKQFRTQCGCLRKGCVCTMPEAWPDAVARLIEIKTNKVDVTLSVNPLDILMCSEKCTYSSCVNFAGQQANGSIACALDNFSAIAFVTGTEGKKTSRAFVYIPEPRRHIIIGYVYGEGLRQLSEVLASTVSDRISAHLGISARWRTTKNYKIDREYMSGAKTSGAGGDDAVFVDVTSTCMRQAPDSEGPPVLNFPRPICLQCGEITTSTKLLCCNKCVERMTNCGHCGREFAFSTGHQLGDRMYCRTCFDAFPKCCHCDYRPQPGTGYVFYIHKDAYDNYRYCNRCVEKYFKRCSNTGCPKYISKDSMPGTICWFCVRAPKAVPVGAPPPEQHEEEHA